MEQYFLSRVMLRMLENQMYAEWADQCDSDRRWTELCDW